MTRATATPATPAPASRARRPSDTIVADLLDAAAVEFAAHGFAGASTRRIAQRAGAHQPQINYHFTSKEQLWRATVDHLFSLMDAALPGPGGTAPLEEAFVDLLHAFIRFSADHPELDRIINLEATDRSDRLEWLVATHLRPRFEAVAAGWRRLRAAGVGADLSPGEVWEVVTSYGAMHFANAPMLSLLGITGGDGRSESDAHAARVLAVLLPSPAGRGSAP
jgi:AcrR family transcriptional regulator